MKNRARSLLLVSALLVPAAAWADDLSTVSGRVVHVSDGDTITVKDADGTRWEIRMYGVDTPEHKNQNWAEQPHAKRAHAFTEGLILNEDVTVRFKMILEDGELAIDRTWQRWVGEVFFRGQSLSRLLIEHGHGWWNKKYAPEDFDMRDLQDEAQKARRGLWSASDPTPPWTWRKG